MRWSGMVLRPLGGRWRGCPARAWVASTDGTRTLTGGLRWITFRLWGDRLVRLQPFAVGAGTWFGQETTQNSARQRRCALCARTGPSALSGHGVGSARLVDAAGKGCAIAANSRIDGPAWQAGLATARWLAMTLAIATIPPPPPKPGPGAGWAGAGRPRRAQAH